MATKKKRVDHVEDYYNIGGAPPDPTDEVMTLKLVKIKSSDRWARLFDLIDWYESIGRSDVASLFEEEMLMEFIPEDQNVTKLKELIERMTLQLSSVPKNRSKQKEIIKAALKESKKILKTAPYYDPAPEIEIPTRTKDEIQQSLNLYQKIFSDSKMSLKEYKKLLPKPTTVGMTRSKGFTSSKEMKEEIVLNRSKMHGTFHGLLQKLLAKLEDTRLQEEDYREIYWQVGMETSEIGFVTKYVDLLTEQYRNNPSNDYRIKANIDKIAFQVIDKLFRVDPESPKPYKMHASIQSKLTYLKASFNSKVGDAYRKYVDLDHSENSDYKDWVEEGMIANFDKAKRGKQNKD